MCSRLVPAVFALLVVVVTPARASFLSSLSPEKKQELGLAGLTPEQAAGVDAAVEGYLQPQTAAVAKKAADTAVIEYRAKQEPVIVEQAVTKAKQREAEDRVEKFSSKIIGRFSGWGGQTLFALDNGQVWQQTGSEVYSVNPVENPLVEIRRAPSGHHRLYLPDGTWITVKRVR
jgi:hypothetical protein